VDLTTFHQLRSPEGEAALLAARELSPTPEAFLSCFQKLEKRFLRNLAKAALETVLLRQKAKKKFQRADEMFFTAEALEQSSGEGIARYRAKRFVGFERVGDFCCGIGGDTLALAQQGQVIAIDRDPLRIAMATANTEVHGLDQRIRFLCDDLLQMDLPSVDGVFFDPHRRADQKRHIAIREYEPSLALIRQRLPRDLPMGVKVAPGVSWNELNELEAEIEFLSVGGELKDCVLWFNTFRTSRRRATLLPTEETIFAEEVSPKREISVVKRFLYDPDPAIIRAGLVTNLADQFDANQIDPTIAFLTSDEKRTTPFAKIYEIQEVLPFNEKALRSYCRSHKIGRLTIIKRGSPVDVNQLQKRLKLDGDEHRVLILTQVDGKPTALMGHGS
jgi:SAM-dependent methyltransferase